MRKAAQGGRSLCLDISTPGLEGRSFPLLDISTPGLEGRSFPLLDISTPGLEGRSRSLCAPELAQCKITVLCEGQNVW